MLVGLSTDRKLTFEDENGRRWRAERWEAITDMYEVWEVVPFWRFWARTPRESRVVKGEYISWCLRNCGTIQGPS